MTAETIANLNTLRIDELRTYATEHDIPLTGLTRKADVVTAIAAALDAVDEPHQLGEYALVDDPSRFPAVVVDALVSAKIDVARVRFWRLEGNRIAVGHLQGGLLVGSKLPLSDEQVAELVDLDVTRGGAA